MEKKSNLQIRRSCQETTIQVDGEWRRRGLRGCAYMVWPIRNDLALMSQWAQHPWNLESPEAAPAWPFAMAAQQPSRKKLEEGAPVLCGRHLC
jgi:hypothetical protein